ncbi:MAG TPA: peptidoglycan-binding domain-containing protein [Bacillota bacterium]|nr:peptidoglycan-binding domain-containing protein [Bacillota bacterium]HPT86574.1 peptidoglycan-binding domain-containing protein [Bacillota bacterium]
MAWQIVTVDQLPLGYRVLRYGCRGKDVEELQKLLVQGGFYFGEVDGYYGVLTEEAVILAEKTFKLRIDGIAGRQVVSALQQLAKKAGRIVYTVKKHDRLENISQKFGVMPGAWDSIAGQGNPRKKLFPGMKLMLSEKALFAWEETPSNASSPLFTATFYAWAEIALTGQLESQEVVLKDGYHGIGASGEVWEAILTNRSCQQRLIADLKKMPGVKFGLDLRNIPPALQTFRSKFLRSVLKGINKRQLDFLVITADPDLRRLKKPISFSELEEVSSYGRWVLVEPQFSLGNQEVEGLLKVYWQLLPKLNRITMHRIFPMVSTNGWEWSGQERRCVSYRECKILRALYYRSSRYLPEIFCTRVDWVQQGESRHLYYRDNQGWVDYLDYLKRYHFPGTVICQPSVMENTLSQLVPNVFAMLPGSKLKDL